ncbi:MAG: hypothetical protein HXY46_06515 [Syntrophaceae bacterium]|nr:hypothetical protein [Syntrophaceae bacterium]
MLQNPELISWGSGLLESGKNESYELPREVTTYREKIHSQVKFRILDKLFGSLWVCVENPRNEIDNPIRYCTQPLYTAISTFMVTNLRENFLKEQNVSWSWNILVRLQERLNSRIQIDLNVPPGWWGLLRHGAIPIAEYCVLAYMAGKISAEKAIELSGVDQVEFASMVREKTQERQLPIFRAYLKGEAAEDQLPFSEEASNRFKDLMAKEVE